jgi:ABC-2 type transport system permease protein
MLKLINLEIYKTAKQYRSMIGYVAVLVIIPLVLIGLYSGGSMIEKEFLRGLEGQFFVIGSLMNGYTAAIIVMNFIWVHIPFLITLVAGDILSGEAVRGTSRMLFSRRASRAAILWSKLIVSLLYACSLIVILAVVSVGMGTILMGTGDLLIMGLDGITLLGEDVALKHLGYSYLLSMLPMCCVASLAFLFGTIVENPVGPIVGSMAVVIVLLTLSSLQIELFDIIRPWLFTSHFDIWQLGLIDPLPLPEIMSSMLNLLSWIALFVVFSFVIFGRKDILS